MSELLGTYGFFIVIGVLMVGCHVLHVGGRDGGDGGPDRLPDGGGHGR